LNTQELMFRLDGMKPFGLYLTFVQFIVYSLFAFTEGKLRGGMKRRIPMKTYIQLAFYTVATMGLTNASVGYLNYPTHLIFKCCKLIPVLIGGIIIQGKKYGWLDLLAASLMSFGLIIFTLADSKVAPNFDPRGYVMICLALLADAIIGNVQEKVMHTYGATNNEVIFYSYTIGSIYIFSGLLITGQFTDAFIFFLQIRSLYQFHNVYSNHCCYLAIIIVILFTLQNSWRTYGYAILFGTLGYLGVNMVLSLIRTSGALLTVTVTTVRKAITIILSFLLFAKPFTITYLWGGLIVLFSIYLNLYNKNRSKWNPILFQWISYVTGADQIMSSRYKSSELM
uniref:Adenosine 3'-phospho 5'-phosphosulfate transporter 2 n=1 Tax=Toxocara canis TaxID=6265 RepID=A0A183V2W3_TOXCA